MHKTVGWSRKTEWLQSSDAASLYILIAFQHGFETLESKIQHVHKCSRKFLPDSNFSVSKQSYINGPVKCLLTTCDVCSLFYMGENWSFTDEGWGGVGRGGASRGNNSNTITQRQYCLGPQTLFTEGFLTSCEGYLCVCVWIFLKALH